MVTNCSPVTALFCPVHPYTSVSHLGTRLHGFICEWGVFFWTAKFLITLQIITVFFHTYANKNMSLVPRQWYVFASNELLQKQPLVSKAVRRSRFLDIDFPALFTCTYPCQEDHVLHVCLSCETSQLLFNFNVCLCTTCVPGPWGDPKKVLDPRCLWATMWVKGIETGSAPSCVLILFIFKCHIHQ